MTKPSRASAFVNHLWWLRIKIKPETVLQLSSYVTFPRLCTPPTRPPPNSPCAARNFK